MAFLKEHCKVQELEATIAKQQKDFQVTATRRQLFIRSHNETLSVAAMRVTKKDVSTSLPRFE